MAQIFTSLLLTSGIGTALALILTLLKPITRKVFSGGWHYYMWLTVLLVMILPVRLNVPEKPVITPPVSETITENQVENSETPVTMEIQPEQVIQEQTAQPEKVSIFQAIKEFLITNLRLFSLIWLIGAVLLFLIKIISYLAFLIKMHRHSEVISCSEVKSYTDRKIKTRESDKISSPLVVGMIRPTLLLPKTDITPEQLNNVLAHEMTHLKRNDILYKWFVSIVKCVHWFNPAIYFISKQINLDCEISCDLAVVKEMDAQQEKGYAETILALLTHNNSRTVPLTTGMTGNKKTLKRRFTMIKKRKSISTATQILSTILAVVVFVTSIITSGVLATAVFEDNSNIHFTCNGKVIDFTNKPFYENNTVYLPVRELFEKIGVMDHKNSSIEWNDGRIVIRLAYDDEIAIYDNNGNDNGTKTQTLNFCYAIEIGKTEIVLNPPESPISSSNNPAYIAHLSAKTEMQNAPLLKNSTTYVPYEYIDRMLGLNMRGLGSDGVYGPYNIICIVDNENPVTYITPAFTWPSESENISNIFGKRVHPITGEEKIHNGIDISAPENSPVLSITYGEVTDTGFDEKFGNYVIIENDNGVKAYYGHLSAVEVAKGDKVKQRAVIGKVGKTGTAAGANLHFEIQINGEYYDPEMFWSAKNTGTVNASYSTSQKESSEVIQEVVLYDCTPEQAMIEKNSGCYFLPTKTIIAAFPDIKNPISVTAYYTEEGRSLIQELAKTTVPYDYQTMSKVLTMQVEFPENAISGALWFVYDFEDGTRENSQIYYVRNESRNTVFPYIVNTYEKTPDIQIQEHFDNSKVVVRNTYYELSNGTWKSGNYTYKYRLVLTGRLNNAVKDSTYIILSNTEDITFEQAWKASGFSSNSNDYFKPEVAVIVGVK